VSGQDTNTPVRPLTYQWTQTAGTPTVTLTNATTATPTFTAPTLDNGAEPSTLTFQVTVSNGVPALDATATTTVTVNAPAIVGPTADAGPSQAVNESAVVTLQGSGVDHNTPLRPLTFTWTQVPGPPGSPAVTLTNASTANPTFTTPSMFAEDPPLTLTFSLVVSNGIAGMDATSQTTVTVTALPVVAPTASVGSPQTVASGALVTLAGSGSDTNSPQRPLSFAWAQTGGTPTVALSDSQTTGPTFTAPMLSNGADPATLTFQLTVSNGVPALNTSASTSVTVTAPPVVAPTGSVGAQQPVASGASVTLSGSGEDHNNPPRPLTFAWTQTSGPSVALVNATTTSPSFTAPALGNGADPLVLGFDLKISNGVPALDLTVPTTVTVNAPPIVSPTGNAGPSQTVTAGAAVTLSGSAQDHNTPLRPLAYAWTQIDGPAVSLLNATAPAASFVAPDLAVDSPPVTLGFALLVSNGGPASSFATTVTILPPLSALAAADAVFVDGANAQTTAPMNVGAGDLLVAFASAEGPDGVPQSLGVDGGGLPWALQQRSNAQAGSSEVWTAIAPAALDGVTVTTTPAVTSTESIPAFNVSLAVLRFPQGAIGAVNGGSSVNGTPLTTVTTTSSGSMVYGAGNDSPEALSRVMPAGQTLVHEYLEPGRGTHWLQTVAGGPIPSAPEVVTLSDLTTAANRWNLAAIEIVNRSAPSVDAGAAQVVYPSALVTLSGSASDPNVPARPLAYLWTQASGPAVTLVNSSAPGATFAASDVPAANLPATLVFALTVSNGSLATVKTTTVTIVSPFVVTATDPAGSAIGVTSTPVVSATFSQPIDPATVTPSAVVLYDAAMTPVPATVAFASSTLTLTPTAPLAYVTTYTAKVAGGSAGVKDAAGSMLSGDYSWTFTTLADLVPPVMTDVRARSSTGSATITWVTNEPATSRVDFGTTPDALTSQAEDLQLVTGHSLTLTGLAANTTYYYRVTSIDGVSNGATAPAPISPPHAFYVASPSGLVAALAFDEGTGNVVKDSSGAGNHGTITGATWTAGRYGSGLTFDGVGNWVTIENAPALDLSTGMTLEAWVRPASTTGWQSVLYKERSGEGLSWGLYSTDDSAPPAVYVSLPADKWSHATGVSMLSLNAWTHIVGTYDGISQKLYVNGVMVRSRNVAGAALPSDGPLRIGGNSISIPYGGQFFKGVIDEIRIYNRALTQAEIQADQATPLSPLVTAVTPQAGATGAALGATITATFAGPMNSSSVNGDTVRLLEGNLTPVPAAVSYNATTRTASLTPLTPLKYSTSYTGVVTGGAAGVTNVLGTALGADYSWTFTTLTPDTTAPTITAVKATPGTSSSTITWTTNEASTTVVVYGTSPEALTSTATNAALVTTHSIVLSGLSPATTYYYRVTSADAALNSATSPAPATAPASFFFAGPSGLVAAYNFNEGAGSVVNDLSGAGNAGVVSGASWISEGRAGGALSFDGVGNWVTINDAPSLGLTNAMTLEAWVRPASITGWHTILYKERLDQSPGPSWGLYASDGSAPPAVYSATANNLWRHATGTANLALNTWAHVAGTFNGTSLRLYVNGVLVRNMSVSGAMTPSTGPLRIGGNSVSIPFGGQFFKGLIDEVRVYNRALTQAEVQAAMNNPVR
jgi:hypothetical protein